MKEKLFDKINITSIVANHFRTLVNANSKRSSCADWITFLGLPLLVATAIFYTQPIVQNDNLNLISTSLSIFVGLLINVLVLIFALVKPDDGITKLLVLRETISNISYAILLSLFCLIFCLILFIDAKHFAKCISFIIYLLTAHFFITLLMILKRMYRLFVNELDNALSSSR